MQVVVLLLHVLVIVFKVYLLGQERGKIWFSFPWWQWEMLCKLAFVDVKSLYGDVALELQESYSGKCTRSISSFAFVPPLSFNCYFNSETHVKRKIVRSNHVYPYFYIKQNWNAFPLQIVTWLILIHSAQLFPALQRVPAHWPPLFSQHSLPFWVFPLHLPRWNFLDSTYQSLTGFAFCASFPHL